MFLIFFLAENLHLKILDVMDFSIDEINGWTAYFEIKKEMSQKNG